MQTVKNKTTVLNLVFKEFLRTSISLISVEKLLSHIAKKIRSGILLCFKKSQESKKFMPKRGISRFSIENLLSHSTEKFGRGTLLCFTKFLVSKNFMDKRGGRKYYDFNERIDREMGSIVNTVEDRIQNAILTAIDSIITPKMELAIRSINASSGRDATSVMASSEPGENIGITAPF